MDTHYTATAKLLHWLIALMIFGMLGFGFYMTGLDLSPTKLELYSWHKWAGVTVFLLVLVRLAWRIGHRPPALPAHMPAIERLAAHAGHHLLYLLMLAIPLSGWVMAGGHGDALAWFGTPLPALVQQGSALGRPAHEAHELLGWVLLVLVALHVLAALKHHFVARNDVLRRMLPW